MGLLGKKKFGVVGLAIVTAAAVAWSTGCSANPQSVSQPDTQIQTNIPNTENLKEESLESEAETDSDGAVTEDVPVGETYFFEREDKISTMFYDLQIDGVTFTDAVGDVIAESGHAFMVLDVAITPCGDELIFNMYAQEFLMVCFTGDSVGQDYEKLYPLKEGIDGEQLEEVWLATVGEEIKGKLVYDIPKDALRTVLLVYDSYTTGDSDETVFGDGYMMTIPEENWSRETK